MTKNEANIQSKNQNCQYQEQVDFAIKDACKKYQKHRNKAENQISQGARLTKYQIKL